MCFLISLWGRLSKLRIRRQLPHNQMFLRRRALSDMKFRLNRARVYTMVVQDLANIPCDVHVFPLAGHPDVYRSYNLVLGKLPNVQLVHRKNARNPLDSLTNGFERDGRRNRLEKDERRAAN